MTSIIKNSSKLSDTRSELFTPSTLLIPGKLLNYFNSRVAFFGNRKLYFRHLIITYGRHLSSFGLKPVSGKWKKEYQKEGLDLQPRNFKPEPEYWEEFRHISFAYGLGMCKLFVVLLKLEQKRWQEVGCPKNFFENPPRPSRMHTHGMNSELNLASNDRISLESLLKAKKSTILIRSIDFVGMELQRIVLIAQD